MFYSAIVGCYGYNKRVQVLKILQGRCMLIVKISGVQAVQYKMTRVIMLMTRG